MKAQSKPTTKNVNKPMDKPSKDTSNNLKLPQSGNKEVVMSNSKLPTKQNSRATLDAKNLENPNESQLSIKSINKDSAATSKDFNATSIPKPIDNKNKKQVQDLKKGKLLKQFNTNELAFQSLVSFQLIGQSALAIAHLKAKFHQITEGARVELEALRLVKCKRYSADQINLIDGCVLTERRCVNKSFKIKIDKIDKNHYKSINKLQKKGISVFSNENTESIFKSLNSFNRGAPSTKAYFDTDFTEAERKTHFPLSEINYYPHSKLIEEKQKSYLSSLKREKIGKLTLNCVLNPANTCTRKNILDSNYNRISTELKKFVDKDPGMMTEIKELTQVIKESNSNFKRKALEMSKMITGDSSTSILPVSQRSRQVNSML